MKLRTILFASMLAATCRAVEDAPAAVEQPALEVTKESLIERIEALLEKGVTGVETLLHDAITDIEDFFAGDEEVGNADAGATQPATDAPADTSDEPPVAE